MGYPTVHLTSAWPFAKVSSKFERSAEGNGCFAAQKPQMSMQFTMSSGHHTWQWNRELTSIVFYPVKPSNVSFGN